VEEITRLQQELEKQKRKMQVEIQRLHHQIEGLENQMGAN
jgi:cell division septum initiation protein DivIVA